MALTIARICANTEKTYGMKLIAGRAGLENYVRWVHIVEDSEVPDFMHGNELVFTTGIAHFGNEWLLDFVTGLKKRLQPDHEEIHDTVESAFFPAK